MRSRLRAQLASSQVIPFILGGIAGAAWMLVFFGHVAQADDCLRYVREVKNFVAIPKDLLEDCMRTGSVQAIITAILGASGGGVIAIAVGKGLKGAATGEKEEPVENEDGTRGPTDYSPVFENDVCSNCGQPLGEMTAGGRCRNCNTRNPVTNVGKCPRCGKIINLDSGECVACGATFKGPPQDPPPDKPTADPPKDFSPVFENDVCSNCGAPLGDMTPGGRCPNCSSKNAVTNVGKCPRCGRVINLDGGECVACGATFDPPAQAPPPDKATSGPPTDYSQVFENDVCSNCGAPLGNVTPGGRCPNCSAQNPVTNVGKCPRCGKVINLDSGVCIACGETFKTPPTTPPPEKPAGESETDPSTVKDPKAVFDSDTCRFCGAPLPPGRTADGRCPACGARNQTSAAGSDPTSANASTQSGETSTTSAPATSTAGTVPSSGATSQGGSSSTANPDLPFTQQGVIKGDKAADLLEQAGLAKVTRDADGKPIRIDEAFPGAFTNLGGSSVTLQTGESSGAGTGPDWVGEAKGRVTGIAFKPAADGGIGEPVIVVDYGDSQWREQPAAGGSTATPSTSPSAGATSSVTSGSTTGATSGGATGATSSGSGATPSSGPTPAEDANLAEVRSRLEQIDSARAAFNIAKAGLPGDVAMSAAQDLARDLGMNPDDARKLLEMDDDAWAKQKFWAINANNPNL